MLTRRTFSTAAVAVPLVSQLWLPAWAQGAAVGQAAPGFTATDTSGKVHRLSDFKGRFVVLEWTNPGCPFVRKHYGGNMQASQQDAVGKGAVWLAINSTEEASADYLPPARLAAWMQDRQAQPTATLMDASGQIGQLYGARTTPHMYIVDPQGRLVYAGAIDSVPSARVDDIRSATNYVRQGLAEGLAGKPLSVATSRAYGCAVKYKA